MRFTFVKNIKKKVNWYEKITSSWSALIFLVKAMKKEILLTGVVGSSCADLGVTKATVDTLGFFSSYLLKLPQILSLTCSWGWRGCGGSCGCGRNWIHRSLCYPAGIDQHWHSVGGCRALKLYIWGPLFFWLAGRASQFRGLQVDLRVDWDHRECALEGLALDLEWLLNHLLIL